MNSLAKVNPTRLAEARLLLLGLFQRNIIRSGVLTALSTFSYSVKHDAPGRIQLMEKIEIDNVPR